MSEPPPYDIAPADAIYLMALKQGESVPKRSAKDLERLLGNVLGLSQSLNDNCREWLEMAGIIHGGMHPYQAEKLNIPTLDGALQACVGIPRIDQDCGMCHTCAFRVGSPANQTVATASDIYGCIEDGEKFYCHDVPVEEAPKKLCRGFAESRKGLSDPADSRGS